jgi:hypothetical protein
VGFAEKITIFCQMVGMFENDFLVSDYYVQEGTVEYALKYPKQYSTP